MSVTSYFTIISILWIQQFWKKLGISLIWDEIQDNSLNKSPTSPLHSLNVCHLVMVVVKSHHCIRNPGYWNLFKVFV